MRLGLCGLLAALMILVAAPPALADAAGPTNYRTDIVSVEPATPAIQVEMIGGDAFLSIAQLEPVEILVLGYQAEPYLQFDTDGTVFENRRSPAVWLNQERYGTEEPPAFASAEAQPQWAQVADSGRYAWHDHRSHWMNPAPPPSATAGDQVLEATVPILVDGQQVTITVASFLLDTPSNLPAAVGALVGLVAGAFGWQSGRASRSVVTTLVAIPAAIVGFVAFTSVPAETEPSLLLWLLPVIAAVALVTALAMRSRTATTVYLDGLAVTAGATLAGWGWFRLDALTRALIPSNVPAALDRLVIAAAICVGLIIAANGVLGLLRPERLLATPVQP